MKTAKFTHPDIDFMALVSHQLSTPLAAVRWYAELLRKGKLAKPLDDTQAQFVDEILEGAARMGELVGDMSNASRLDRNKYTDEPTPTAWASIITDERDQLQADLGAKQHQLTLHLDQSLPPVQARPTLMHMITQNLLTNAIKYTPDHGRITANLRPASAAEAARLKKPAPEAQVLEVADDGYGIPQAQQPHIFEKFFRADNVRALGIYGSGLGLYIVATAAAKLGGHVWFESAEQKGSRFFVVLPSKKRSAKK